MKNYLVISYLADSGQIVFDTVLAADRDAGESEVLRVRGDDIDAIEVHETVEFASTVAAWAAETPVETWESWNVTVESSGAKPQPRPEAIANERSASGTCVACARRWDNEVVMTVRLELKPDVEANLTARARARGVALDAYLQGVLEELARTEISRSANAHDVAATLDALAEMGRDLPILPTSALSRESIYQDHN